MAEIELDKEPPHTRITRNPIQREKLLDLIKRYEKGDIKTYEDIARGMRVSLRTTKSSIKRLKWETSYKEVEEEAKGEVARKYKALYIFKEKALESPIAEIDKYIRFKLNRLRPRSRRQYATYQNDCWEFIVQKYGLYDPVSWTKDEVEDFINSPKVIAYKSSTQNRVRTAINSLMKFLGKRDIFFEKLEEEEPIPVMLSVENREKIFRGFEAEYPDKAIIYNTITMIGLKTATRIGIERGRDPDDPMKDRGMLGIRTRSIFLDEKPVRINLRDKGKGEAGKLWDKHLDEEGEIQLRKYLAWRKTHRPGWKDNPFLFGDTTYDEYLRACRKIRKKYDIYEIDRRGIKRWFTPHMLRDTFANEVLLAFGHEKGFLPVAELGGWQDLTTLRKHYITAEVINQLKRKWIKELEGKIKTKREPIAPEE